MSSSEDSEDPKSSTEPWELIGDCYIHGFMNNEILRPEFSEKSQMFFVTCIDSLARHS